MRILTYWLHSHIAVDLYMWDALSKHASDEHDFFGCMSIRLTKKYKFLFSLGWHDILVLGRCKAKNLPNIIFLRQILLRLSLFPFEINFKKSLIYYSSLWGKQNRYMTSKIVAKILGFTLARTLYLLPKTKQQFVFFIQPTKMQGVWKKFLLVHHPFELSKY